MILNSNEHTKSKKRSIRLPLPTEIIFHLPFAVCGRTCVHPNTYTYKQLIIMLIRGESDRPVRHRMFQKNVFAMNRNTEHPECDDEFLE